MHLRLLGATLAAVLTAPVAGAAAGTTATTTATTAATTAGAATAPAGATRTVDLALTLPAATAVPRGTVGALRSEAVAALTPAAPTRSALLAAVRSLGLTPAATQSGDSTLAVEGPEALVHMLFPARDATAGALAVPAALTGYVTAALDPAAVTPLWHGFDTTSHPNTGAQLDAAYAVSPLPSAAVPTLTATTGIVATLQLSGWSNSDLTAYAPMVYGSASTYDPVASGQYTAVLVGRGEATTTDDGNGDGEVALDQETLLAAAPQLKQRAYFAPNSSAGVMNAVSQVLADVKAGLPILSFSSSYGGCESDIDSSTAAAMDKGFAALAAAGVTVFAASGDSGQYCAGSSGGGVLGGSAATVQATFPASAPSVVGVGGTRHENGAGPALPDPAWDNGGSGASAEGSGGGTSTLFTRPGYQAGLAPTGGGSGRLVPDLALDGDPATGIITITRGTKALTGGTSLAAPLAAAQLADLVAARAPAGLAPAGAGDIHALLYANRSALTDVVAIQDGTATPADQPTTAGYDLATGLGTPNWTALAAVLFTSAPPGLQVPATSKVAAVPVAVSAASGVAVVQVFASLDTDNGCSGGPLGLGTSTLTVPDGTHTVIAHTLTRSGQCSAPAAAQVIVDSRAPTARVTSFGRIATTSQILRLTWSGSDASPGSGLSAYLVSVSHKGGSTPDLSTRVPASTTSMTLLVKGGADEVLSVTPVDAFGNVGATARSAQVDVPVDDRSARLSTGWKRGKAPHTYSGTVSTTSRKGATAAITLRGSVIGFLATTTRNAGSVALVIDGKVVKTFSLRSTKPGVRKSFTVKTGDRSHAVVLRAVGNGPVVLDALIAG